VGSGEQLRQLFYILDSANRFGKMLHSVGDSPRSLVAIGGPDAFPLAADKSNFRWLKYYGIRTLDAQKRPDNKVRPMVG